VLADRDQGAGRARERLLDRNLVEVRLCEASTRLLVRGSLERAQERLAGRKVAVEGSARDSCRGRDVGHAGCLASGEYGRRGREDFAPGRRLRGSAHDCFPLQIWRRQ
jgi:hypothetical protein